MGEEMDGELDLNLPGINSPHHAKILVAMGMDKTAVVMATDSELVAEEVSAISAYTDDLGVLEADDYKLDPGIYLWEGVVKMVFFETMDGPEPETEYHGKLREIKPEELEGLVAMQPPRHELELEE